MCPFFKQCFTNCHKINCIHTSQSSETVCHGVKSLKTRDHKPAEIKGTCSTGTFMGDWQFEINFAGNVAIEMSWFMYKQLSDNMGPAFSA